MNSSNHGQGHYNGHMGLAEDSNCTVSAEEWVATQSPAIITGTVTIVTQLMNFLFFRFWRNKESFVLFHVSLAISSLLAGICMVSSVFLRYVPLTHATIASIRLFTMPGYWFFHCSSLVTLLFIGVDRWISVEFPVKYQNFALRRNVLLAISVVWLVSFLLLAPGIAVYWNDIVVTPCNRRKVFNPSGIGPALWNLVKGPVFLPFFLLTQLRIVMIAAKAKFRLRRLQKIGVAGNGYDAGNRGRVRQERLQSSGICVVWSSLLASMTMVMGALIANIPTLVVQLMGIPGSVLIVRVFYYLSSLQHCYSPLVYLVFFPDYRRILSRICTRGYRGLRLVFPAGSASSPYSDHGSRGEAPQSVAMHTLHV